MRHSTFWSRCTLYLQLIRFDKPVGSLLLLWPTLSALWIASDGRPPLTLLLIFIAGTVLMRAAGCERKTGAAPGAGLRRGAGVDRLYAAFATECAHARLILRRALPCGELSVYQALLCVAASVSGHRIRLWHPDGIRRRSESGPACSVGDARGKYVLDNGV